ncbi:MAG: hypothetical protein R6X12_04560, partial [bacterium]
MELFAGDHGAGGAYNLEIRDITAGQVVAEEENRTPGGSHTWLKFNNIQMELGRSFTKGKQYEFKFTRSGSDSINYYYNPYDPYEYGSIVLPGGSYQPPPTSADLCARVYGIAQTENSKDLFGSHLFQLAMWRDWRQGANPVEGWDAWSDSAAAVGIGWAREGLEWGSVQSESGGSFSFAYKYDTAMIALATRGIKPFVILCYTPKWASS